MAQLPIPEKKDVAGHKPEPIEPRPPSLVQQKLGDRDDPPSRPAKARKPQPLVPTDPARTNPAAFQPAGKGGGMGPMPKIAPPRPKPFQHSPANLSTRPRRAR